MINVVNFPKLKKKIESFLTKEDGKISKENIVKTGIVLSVAAAAAVKNSDADCPPTIGKYNDHCNGLSVTMPTPKTVKATHNHAVNEG